jgi:hypothetical protein
MINRIHILCFVILFACFYANTSVATDTLSCQAGDLELMFHVGSEGYISDLQLYESKDKCYVYDNNDFSTHELKWLSSEEPFKGNKIKLIRQASSNEQPAINLTVEGEYGVLIFKGRRYRVRCDWVR